MDVGMRSVRTGDKRPGPDHGFGYNQFSRMLRISRINMVAT